MSYCVHCGVELSDSDRRCPLCGTVVIDPATLKSKSAPNRPLYPAVELPELPRVSRRSIFLLFAVLLLIPSFVTLVCNLSLSGRISWSAYVLGAALALLLTVLFILFAHKLRSYGVVLCTGAVWTVYAFFVEFLIAGRLKVPFSLPILIYLTLSIALCCLPFMRHASLAKLIAAGLLLAGGLCLLIEWRICSYFGSDFRFIWSYYPAGTCLLLALLLLIIDRSAPLKAKLRKKFFI